jgi:hypothetical protein
MTPRVRVYVPTYHRAHLLPRALRSLQAQTFRHWEAVVRNDAPGDTKPADVVAQFGESRIRYIAHERTIGGTAVFNLTFSDQAREFVALLEDDNWWEPTFLERMIAALEANPDITLAWANQFVWQERPDGSWHDTGRTVRPPGRGARPVRMYWPHFLQCHGALHANGTMLLRTQPGRTYPTPPMELGGTEAVRERSLPHPLLYVPEALGVFAATQVTNRAKDAAIWATNQVLMTATFLKHAVVDASFHERLWANARAASPRMTGTLLLATFQEPALRWHRRYAKPDDWRHLGLRSLRRPVTLVKLRRARHRAPAIWEFLDRHSAERAREAAARGCATWTNSFF